MSEQDETVLVPKRLLRDAAAALYPWTGETRIGRIVAGLEAAVRGESVTGEKGESDG